jgi:diacylglycerol kinase (ATP)
MGALTAFPNAKPDDGVLEIGVVTAAGALQWVRTLARTAAGKADKSPFVRTTRGTKFDIRFAEKTAYELDGGDRKPKARLRVKVHKNAITVCVPEHSE